MKHILFTVLTVICSYAVSSAQDFYQQLPHTPVNHNNVQMYRQQQQLSLNKLNAYMAVLSLRYHDDKRFHVGRTYACREHTLYNDVLAIQLQEQAINRTVKLIGQLDKWLLYYDNNE